MTHDDPTDVALLVPPDEIPQTFAPASPQVVVTPAHRGDPTGLLDAAAPFELPEDVMGAGPVIPLPYRTVSGCYRGSSGGFQVARPAAEPDGVVW
jgi:hypothetical protein